MHQQWTEIAQQVGMAIEYIPAIFTALGITDSDHPTPAHLEDFEEICSSIVNGKSMEAAAADVIAKRTEPTQLMNQAQGIEEAFPTLDQSYIHELLKILDATKKEDHSTASVLTEFAQLHGLVQSSTFKDWEQVHECWQQQQAKKQTDEAITLSPSGTISTPSKIPEPIHEGLAAPIIEEADENTKEVPEKIASAQETARADVMDGLDEFVKGTYYRAMQENMQTPEFLQKVREALRSKRSQNDSDK